METKRKRRDRPKPILASQRDIVCPYCDNICVLGWEDADFLEFKYRPILSDPRFEAELKCRFCGEDFIVVKKTETISSTKKVRTGYSDLDCYLVEFNVPVLVFSTDKERAKDLAYLFLQDRVEELLSSDENNGVKFDSLDLISISKTAGLVSGENLGYTKDYAIPSETSFNKIKLGKANRSSISNRKKKEATHNADTGS